MAMFDLPTLGRLRTSTHDITPSHETLVLDSIEKTAPGEWNNLVERLTEGTIFHRHEWLAAIEEGYDHVPCHVEIRKDGNLIGILPQFGMDLPKVPFRQVRSIHPGFGGPVISTDRKATLNEMLSASAKLCRGRRVLHEIRACNPELLRYHDPLYRAGYRPARYKGRFVIDIDRSYEEVFADMDGSRRRGITNGRQTDHRIVAESLTSDLINRLSAAHESNMDAVDADPYPPSFFEALRAMEEQVLTLSVYYEEEFAGSYVYLLDSTRKRMHYTIAALPPEYFRHGLSELLHDAGIQWGIDRGFTTYDMGGGGGDFENGVFRFKKKFGGQLEPNFYWERGFGLLWPILKKGRSVYLKHDPDGR